MQCPYEDPADVLLEPGSSLLSQLFGQACRHELVGTHMNVSYAGLAPYLVHDKYNPGGADVEILKIFAKKFEFTYSLKRQPTWILFNPKTGKLEGSVGQVSNCLLRISCYYMKKIFESLLCRSIRATVNLE